MMTDPIAAMLTSLRNALRSGAKPEVRVPVSRMKLEIARVLKEEGYIDDYSQEDRDLVLKLKSKRNSDRPLNGLKRISRSGLRVYVGKADVPQVNGGLGDAIISTSSGVKTGRQARREGLGGEVLAYVW